MTRGQMAEVGAAGAGLGSWLGQHIDLLNNVITLAIGITALLVMLLRLAVHIERCRRKWKAKPKRVESE